MHKYRWIALCLTIIMMLSFTACSDSSGSRRKDRENKKDAPSAEATTFPEDPSSSEDPSSPDDSTPSKATFETPLTEFVKLVNKNETDALKYQRYLMNPYEYANNIESFKLLADANGIPAYVSRNQSDMKEVYNKYKNIELTYQIVTQEPYSDEKISELNERWAEYYASEFDEEYIQDLNANLEPDQVKEFSDAMGVSEQTVTELFQKVLDNVDDYKNAKFTAGYLLQVEFTLKYNGAEETVTSYIAPMEMNGTWYMENSDELFRELNFDDMKVELGYDLCRPILDFKIR